MAAYDTTTYLLDRANISDVCMRLVSEQLVVLGPGPPHRGLGKASLTTQTGALLRHLQHRRRGRPARPRLRGHRLGRLHGLRVRAAEGLYAGGVGKGDREARRYVQGNAAQHYVSSARYSSVRLLSRRSRWEGQNEETRLRSLTRVVVSSSTCPSRAPAASDLRSSRWRRMPRELWSKKGRRSTTE